MGIVRGTNIVRDSLVFGYDTGYGVADKTRSLRFYKGEPATNAQDSDISAMTQTGFNNWGAYDGNNTPHHTYSSTTQTKTLVNIPGPDGELTNAMLYHNVSGGSFGPTNWSGVPQANLANGKKITLQAWVKAADSSFVGKSVRPHLYYNKVGGGAYSASTNHSLTMEWQLVKHCYTVPEGSTGNGTFYLFTGSGETKMYVTQTAIIADKLDSVVWLKGGTTRSDTASLIDLKRTNNITLANVSFNSTGQPDFDGTDDRLDNITGVGISNYSAPFSMECVFKVPTDGTWANSMKSNVFSIAGSYAGQYGIYKKGTDTIGFQIRDSSTGGYCENTGHSKNVYHHVVVTFGGGSGMSLYINGEFKTSNSTSFTGTPDNTNLYIGGQRAFGGNVGSWYEGEIPVAKYYNKQLTAVEIKQNFDAYKNRFNI